MEPDEITQPEPPETFTLSVTLVREPHQLRVFERAVEIAPKQLQAYLERLARYSAAAE